MIRPPACNPSCGLRWPRTSGDDPTGKPFDSAAVQLAPHERGRSDVEVDGTPRVDVGPARAGMIRPCATTPTRPCSWPRTSGDDPDARNGVMNVDRLAPHERG